MSVYVVQGSVSWEYIWKWSLDPNGLSIVNSSVSLGSVHNTRSGCPSVGFPTCWKMFRFLHSFKKDFDTAVEAIGLSAE